MEEGLAFDACVPKLPNFDSDPNVCVSLAAAAFTTTGSSEVSLLRSIKHDQSLSNGPNIVLHERTVAVLDALAAVCVNSNRSVVAIGLTMKPVQLVVATNNQVLSNTLVEHLKDTCSTLKTISDTKFSNTFPVARLRETSPQLDLDDVNLEAAYHSFLLQSYKYSYDRTQKKHEKRWNIFEEFRSQCHDWVSRTTELQGTRIDEIEPHATFFNDIKDFRCFNMGLQDCLNNFCQSDWIMDREKMQYFKSTWQLLLSCASRLLDGKHDLCDQWAKTVAPCGSPLRLKRTIEKLVTFHRHVFTLIRFACSKRMRSSFFSSDIIVTSAIKKQLPVSSWPSQKRDWLELLRTIYHKRALKREEGEDVKEMEAEVADRAMANGKATTIHCECAVVAFLQRYAPYLAFSYIGVSKLSCKACHYWMKAFNDNMGTTFRTRGTHDKWYGGWARPGLDEADVQSEVDAKFLHYVEDELCLHQVGSGMARSRAFSDSSDSSEIFMAKSGRHETETKSSLRAKFGGW